MFMEIYFPKLSVLKIYKSQYATTISNNIQCNTYFLLLILHFNTESFNFKIHKLTFSIVSIHKLSIRSILFLFTNRLVHFIKVTNNY